MLGIDPFIKEITFLVRGWLRPGNVWCFRHALQHLPNDAPLLEIGSFCGLSTITLLYLKKRFGIKNPLFTCDPWSGPEGQADTPITEATTITYGKLREYVRESFLRNMTYFSSGELPASFQMTSDEFFDAWRARTAAPDLFGQAQKLGGTFAFVYVDGSHTYSFVKRDFENIEPLLEPGGFILFDDSEAETDGGPSRVANEVAELPRYELVHRAPNALFRKRT